MKWRDHIEALRRHWRDRKVEYEGTVYTVIDVDYNGALLIDKPAQFTATTAVAPCKVKML